ncbi:hypothetical protein V8F33_000123 [Rhypophila sp. PSN 637]
MNSTIPSPLPQITLQETTKNLPALILSHYRSVFHAKILTGQAKYFVLPYSILGPTILPIVYLAIPHKNRPWLYQARWAVAALMVGLSVDLLVGGTSSANIVVAYGTGLVAVWGLIWGLTVLLVLDPQNEAARVVKRRRRKTKRTAAGNGHAENGDVAAGRVKKDKEAASSAIDESVALVEDEYEHYWQYYPADGSLLERLGWVMDLSVALKGIGWNFASSALPHPPPPAAQSPNDGPLVNLSSTPQISRTGSTRHQTTSSFILNRLSHIIITLLVLDLCTLIARRDPYFALGPSYPPSQLPPYLASLHPEVLSLARSLTTFIALLSGLDFYLNFHQLITFFSSTCLLPAGFLNWSSPCADELWQYPSPFGPFVLNVLDNGLTGFWGGFWHQTFRIGFTAPVTFLTKNGYLASKEQKTTKQILTLASAFTLSACIHAAGAWTCVPEQTRIHAPFLFFGFSFIGILAEQTLWGYLKTWRCEPPTWLRRIGNLVWVTGWLHFTGRWTFIDDLCSAGLFLFEPIPISPLRWLRVMDSGLEGDDGKWWRWDEEYRGRWVSGLEGRWWEGGLRL